MNNAVRSNFNENFVEKSTYGSNLRLGLMGLIKFHVSQNQQQLGLDVEPIRLNNPESPSHSLHDTHPPHGSSSESTAGHDGGWVEKTFGEDWYSREPCGGVGWLIFGSLLGWAQPGVFRRDRLCWVYCTLSRWAAVVVLVLILVRWWFVFVWVGSLFLRLTSSLTLCVLGACLPKRCFFLGFRSENHMSFITYIFHQNHTIKPTCRFDLDYNYILSTCNSPTNNVLTPFLELFATVIRWTRYLRKNRFFKKKIALDFFKKDWLVSNLCIRESKSIATSKLVCD